MDLAESSSPAEAAQREDGDSSTEDSEPGPAPKKNREKQQEISMLMAADEEEQTEGSILEIMDSSETFRTNTAVPLTDGSLHAYACKCVILKAHY